MTIEEMKQHILELTGIPPLSNDPKHLKERLGELRRSTNVPFSITLAGKIALIGLADDCDLKVSELVRDALVEYAAKRGHKHAAQVIGGGK